MNQPVKINVDADGTKRWYNEQNQLHRDGDLPAVKFSDGTKHWYKNGKLHRDGDLPAMEFNDGSKEWYKDGLRHRDGDLPALDYTNNRKEWYKNGKLHRDGDLPAIELNGTKKWYKNGKLHRDGDLPAIEYINGNKEWYKNGKLHRDGDLPAVIKDGTKKWYTDNEIYSIQTDTKRIWYNKYPVIHRDGDLPAIKWTNGDKEWYKNGKLHRDGDLPAVIKDGTKKWYKNGKLHRDGDLPAVEYSDGNKEWWVNGIRQNQPTKEILEIDDDDTKRWYNEQGQLHRDNDLPAVEFTDGRKSWYKNGKLHRDNDLPAVDYGDYKEWWVNGIRHRDNNLPAIIYDDGSKEWWVNGNPQPQIEDGRVVIDSVGDKVWYNKAGQIHRDGDLPAIIRADGSREWWIDGVQQKQESKESNESKEKQQQDDDSSIPVEKNGIEQWVNKKGELHRGDGLPAIIRADGTREWYKNGKLHRGDDLPAIIRPDGTKEWYINGELHTENDLPAIIRPDGTKEWYKNGVLHRDNDLPAVKRKDGTREWWKNGLMYSRQLSNGTREWHNLDFDLHRDNDLPAVVKKNGDKIWYKNGVIHRDNAPAVVNADGTYKWFKNGVEIKEEVEELEDEPLNTSSVIVQTIDEYLKSVGIFSHLCKGENINWFKTFIIGAKSLSSGAIGTTYENPTYKNIVVKVQNVCDNSASFKSRMCESAKSGKLIFRIPDSLSGKDTLLCSNYISECLVPVVLNKQVAPYTPAFVNTIKTAISEDKNTMYSAMESLAPRPKVFSFDDTFSLLLQTIQGLSVAQRVSKFTHYDLHNGNIMCRDFKDGYSLLTYELPDGRYLYHLTPREYVIIDYGFSRIETTDHIIKPMFEVADNFHDGFSSNPYYDLFTLINTTNTGISKLESDKDRINKLYGLCKDRLYTIGEERVNSWRPNASIMNSSDRYINNATEMYSLYITDILPIFYKSLNSAETLYGMISHLLANRYIISDKLYNIPKGVYTGLGVRILKSTTYRNPFKREIMDTTFYRYNTRALKGNGLNGKIRNFIKIETINEYALRRVLDGKIRNSVIPDVTNTLPYSMIQSIPTDFLDQNITVVTISQSKGLDKGYKFRFDCCGVDMRSYFNSKKTGSGVVINASFFDIISSRIPYGSYRTPGDIVSSRLPLPEKFREYYGIVGVLKDGKRLEISTIYGKKDKFAQFIASGPLLVKESKVVFTEDIMKNEKDNSGRYLFRSRKPAIGEEDDDFFSDGVKNVNKIQPGDLYHAANPNPRSAIAIRGDNIYFIRVGGRDEGDMHDIPAVGMDLSQLADYCKNVLGAEYAINLDGGGSSKICWKDEHTDYINMTGFDNKNKAYPTGNVISFVKARV